MTFNANYTWSHCIGLPTITLLNPGANYVHQAYQNNGTIDRSLDVGDCTSDRRQIFNRRRVGEWTCAAIRPPVVIPRNRFEAGAVPRELLQPVVVVGLEHVVAAQHIGQLSKHQPHIGRIGRDLVRVDQPLSSVQSCLDLRRGQGTYACGQTALDPARELDDFDLHVDGGGQFGMRGAEPPQLGYLA